VRIAVTGAGGRLGGQVVDLLARSGERELVALARRPPPDRAPGAIRWARADYDDPASLRAALRGADTLVLVSSDGPVPAVLGHHEHLVAAAAAANVGHVVALSGLDADPASPFCYAHTAAALEELLRASPCGASIVRASIYTEFFGRWLIEARHSGQLRLPAAAGRISLVSRLDVGRCLAALALGAPTGRHHDVTGPASLDGADAAAIAGAAWGSAVEYVAVTPDEYAAETAAAGEEAWWLYAFSTMFASIRNGRWAGVSDEVERLTGRPPASLAEVLA
jgi:NAD(P)H dehydrogenase (quinone)